MATKLSSLRKYSAVDCDSLDVEVAKSLGPFVDGTSNQVIVHAEAVRDTDISRFLLRTAAQRAMELEPDSTKRRTAAVRIFTVLLSLRILPYLTGRSLIQSSMHEADSISGTVKDALALIKLYSVLSPTPVDLDRVCIKIPSTWAGLQAARILERDHNVRTLCTILFTVEQAAVASQVGATYIAPYINELSVHFVPGAVDKDPGFGVVRNIHEYYKSTHAKTLIMPASLISVDEILSLTGIDHITIPPHLLSKLAALPDDTSAPLQPTYVPDAAHAPKEGWNQLADLFNDEERYKSLFGANSEASRKLDEAILVFMSYERMLEEVLTAELKIVKTEEDAVPPM